MHTFTRSSRRWLATLGVLLALSCERPDASHSPPVSPRDVVLEREGALAAATPRWITTTSTPRRIHDHATLLLPSGKVMVLGGYSPSSSGPVATVELYDPFTGTTSSTGSMLAVRGRPSAVVLPSGKVLVAGGYKVTGSTRECLSSAELWDPALGRWSSTGSLSTARTGATVTLLPSGLVLVVGGYDSNFNFLASAELYDPATGQWFPAAALAKGRFLHTATLLPSGKVLVTGGEGAEGYLTTSELYDPATGWSSTAPLSVARQAHSATLLPSGKVLVAGGASAATSAELYDPVTGTWASGGSLVRARTGHTATLLPTGEVFFAGGSGNLADTPRSGELYNPATRTSTLVSQLLAQDLSAHSATLLPSGEVLVITTFGALFSRPAMVTKGSLRQSRGGHTATLLPDGKVLVVGSNSGAGLSTAELYDPATEQWTSAGSVSGDVFGHTATLLLSGKVLIAYPGGAALYDPATGAFTPTGAPLTQRAHATALLLPQGKVLVSGGYSPAGVHASAELYDPALEAWVPAGAMGSAHHEHTLTLLPSGKVLAVGGRAQQSGSATPDCELYDPATNTWSATGSLKNSRTAHRTVLLPTGKVLAFGGQGFDPGSAELYDTATGQWTLTGSLVQGRAYFAAAVLPSGKVLAAGGTTGTTTGPTHEVELFDPRTSTWSTTATLSVGRQNLSATLLTTGDVLLVGGEDSVSPTPVAEVFDERGGATGVAPAVSPLGPLAPGEAFTVTGTGFRGLPSGSHGADNDSPTNYPILQLRLPSSGRRFSLPGTDFSDTAVTSQLPSLPDGQYLLWVSANALTGGRLVAVQGPNTAPSVQPGGATTAEETPVAVSLSGADVDGDSLSYVVVSGPAHGTLSGTAPDLTYTPVTNYHGEDSFTFRASDGSLASQVATVTLTVTAENDAPTTRNGSVTTFVDTPVEFTLNASDVDGDSLTNTILAPPSHGTLVGAGLQVTYTPNAGFMGQDTFLFRAWDGKAFSNVSLVAIDVSEVPNTPPSTPALIRPASGAQLSDGQVVFEWTASTDAEGDAVTYTLRVNQAGNEVLARTVTQTQLTLSSAEALAPGVYTWNVMAIDARGAVGNVSDESTFTVAAPVMDGGTDGGNGGEPDGGNGGGTDGGTGGGTDAGPGGGPEEPNPPGGCGCSSDSSGLSGMAVLMAAMMLGQRARRRRTQP
jgi:MYXO-CTERM domain-containing protein